MKRLLTLIVVILFVLSGLVYAHTRRRPPVEQPQAQVQSLSASEIIRLVNIERTKIGVPELQTSRELMKSAQEKCDDEIAGDYYGHDNPVTGMHGYEYIQRELPSETRASENLVQINVTDNQEPINRWLASPAHKAAMLNTDYTLTGVGVCQIHSSQNLPYIGNYEVVQHFAFVPA